MKAILTITLERATYDHARGAYVLSAGDLSVIRSYPELWDEVLIKVEEKP